MTLFRVHCPTCHARLKVTSRSLIGQIVNCPKCGSMVEIAEPGGSTPPSEKAESKAAAVTPPVVPPAEPTPTTPPVAETQDTPPDVSNSDAMFDDIDEMLDTDSSAASVAPPKTVAAATPPVEPAAETTSTAATAPIDGGRFSSDANVGKWRNMALIGGISVMSLATIAVIGYAVLSEGNAPAVPTDDPNTQEVAQAEVPAEKDPVTEETNVEPPKPQETEPSSPDETPDPPTPTDSPSESEEVTDAPTNEEKPDESTNQATDSPMTEENPFLFGDPEDQPKDSPPAEEPAQPDADQPVVAATPKSILELKDDPLYEVFGESFPIFDPDAIEGSANNATPQLAQGNPAVPVAEPPPTPELVPPIQEVDVAARLRDPIVEISLKDMPLNEFTSFVTQMSTAPVTLDPLALAYAEINATKPISIQQSRTSVEGILRAAVHPFGLDVVATDHSARLQITQPLDGHQRTMRLQVDDMASDAKEVADLAYLLTHVVEPMSWNHARGQGLYRVDPDAIMITQNEVAQFKSMIFLEKMRVARGLSPKSKYAPELFAVKLRSDQLEPILQKSVNLQIVVPTPMYKVIDQMEKKTGLDILCDWDSLALNKLGPATPVTVSSTGHTVGEMLVRFCQSWKLEALPINAHTVQLVSRSSVPVMPWLEFYDLSEMNLGKSQATAMINEAERQLSDLRKTGYGEVLYDPISKHLLALLSKEDHQKLQYFLQRKMAP
ncbi:MULTISPECIES: hypothetical protein [Pirellulaceae]|nr:MULTISPECIES: hypothetical protein [Pirellulaceae]